MKQDIYLVIGIEGGIPQHYYAFTSRRRAHQRATQMARAYRLPLSGDKRWHDDNTDVYVETVTLNAGSPA